MRIEGGNWRGRVLQTPSGNNTRPTDGRTREMLFNSLGDFVVGARVLDLYAGSGSVGLEALSRGAASCVFVEHEHAALRALRANVKNFRCTEQSQVWNGNARTAIEKLVENGDHFDFIFADPPFILANEATEIARRLDAFPRLLNNEITGTRAGDESVSAVVVIQHSHRSPLPDLSSLVLRRQKRAGESMLSFFVPSFPEPN